MWITKYLMNNIQTLSDKDLSIVEAAFWRTKYLTQGFTNFSARDPQNSGTSDLRPPDVT